MHGAMANPKLLGQAARAPVGAAFRWLGEGGGDHLFDEVLGVGGGATAAGSLLQPVDSSLLETGSPLEHIRLRAAQPAGDHLSRPELGSEGSDALPSRMARPGRGSFS